MFSAMPVFQTEKAKMICQNILILCIAMFSALPASRWNTLKARICRAIENTLNRKRGGKTSSYMYEVDTIDP